VRQVVQLLLHVVDPRRVQRVVPLLAQRLRRRARRLPVEVHHDLGPAEPQPAPLPQRIGGAERPCGPFRHAGLGRQPAEHVEPVAHADHVTELRLADQRLAHHDLAVGLAPGHLEERETLHHQQVAL
jgi:hypothetical protein